jgi:hypothetical protein
MTWRLGVPLVLVLALGEGLAWGAPPKKETTPRPSPKPFELSVALRPWKGDLDGMIKRRRIRVLVVFSRTQYFVDRGAQSGTAYEVAAPSRTISTRSSRRAISRWWSPACPSRVATSCPPSSRAGATWPSPA